MVNNEKDGISRIIAAKWELASFLVVLLLFLLFSYILFPLADGIVLGLVFAYIGRPIFMKLRRFRRLGALIATLCIVVPVVFIIGSGIVEILRQIVWVVENQAYVLNTILDLLRSIDVPATYSDDVQQLVWDVSTSILPLLGRIGVISYARNLVMFGINLFLAIFLCYFLLADGDGLYRAVMKIVPEKHDSAFERFVMHLDVILQGIFVGNASAALIVSVLSLIVFYAFGFTHVLALAALIFVASVIPMFAGYMVLLVLSVYRYLQQGLESASVFFIVASIVIYAPPELVLRPYLASIKSQIHPFLILLAFLGGGFVGGVAGFFLAPIVLGAIVAAYRVYINDNTAICSQMDISLCNDDAESKSITE
ncbi:AI-2E family transporter [Methanolobus bombayensis]|uniref:AI-2E family transporter n=1 Tax=Methanolobus bombayensis TaxID=38023 RepID=UPI001AE5D36E|nr:AI-2E family transporter [Methanolobus bombayensis]MBP1908207.1 putative PurR-regulated permease PerM [Methanolobus bombayensis]